MISIYKDKNMKVVLAYDTQNDRALELKRFSPDVVFYQQPYNIMKKQTPLEVSKYALICYVQKKVKETSGVTLEPEVRLLGEFV